MAFRTDHVAGAAFVLLGLFVLALSGDLPTGDLSMPGAGFLPKIIAVVTIGLGLFVIATGRESPRFASIDWSDLKHAGLIVVLTSIAVALYTTLGFIITMTALLIALLVIAERRNPIRAAAFSVVVVVMAFIVFDRFLEAPLPSGPLGF
jgi:hypothetical protein